MYRFDRISVREIPDSPCILSLADNSSTGFLLPAWGDEARKEKRELGDVSSPYAGRRKNQATPRLPGRNEAMPCLTTWERGNTSSPCAGKRENEAMPSSPAGRLRAETERLLRGERSRR
ncbi:hypothetical protein BHM03_00045932, partial [Ensete ventricosum]